MERPDFYDDLTDEQKRQWDENTLLAEMEFENSLVEYGGPVTARNVDSKLANVLPGPPPEEGEEYGKGLNPMGFFSATLRGNKQNIERKLRHANMLGEGEYLDPNEVYGILYDKPETWHGADNSLWGHEFGHAYDFLEEGEGGSHEEEIKLDNWGLYRAQGHASWKEEILRSFGGNMQPLMSDDAVESTPAYLEQAEELLTIVDSKAPMFIAEEAVAAFKQKILPPNEEPRGLLDTFFENMKAYDTDEYVKKLDNGPYDALKVRFSTLATQQLPEELKENETVKSLVDFYTGLYLYRRKGNPAARGK
jgi:hypothetical protein